jgi:Short C-terminal domain
MPPPSPPAPPSVDLTPTPTPTPKPNIHDPAIEIIRTRYARGEITRQEYRALLDDLA